MTILSYAHNIGNYFVGKSYHYIYHDRMRTARNRTKVTSFEGDEEFKFSKWLDISEHPDIVFDKTHINVVKFSYEAIPGDEYTKHELGKLVYSIAFQLNIIVHRYFSPKFQVICQRLG